MPLFILVSTPLRFLMKKAILLFLFATILQSCDLFSPVSDSSKAATFTSSPTAMPIEKGLVDEASGIADARSMAGNVWVHEDSDNPSMLYLFSHGGILQAKFSLPFPNRDFEDISIGVGPVEGKNYIYLADIGDNLAQYNESYIYRFEEPKSLTESVASFEKITFKYSDGKYDAEALLLDPATKDIYIITKQKEGSGRIYKLSYPQVTNAINIAAFQGTLPITYITSASMSSDGKEILVRNYTTIYYWLRKTDETIVSALTRTQDKLPPYTFEAQGEGICFDRNNAGYYTISERPSQALQTYLYYYAKK